MYDWIGAIDNGVPSACSSTCCSPMNFSPAVHESRCYDEVSCLPDERPLLNVTNSTADTIGPVPTAALIGMIQGSSALTNSLSVSSVGPHPTFKIPNPTPDSCIQPSSAQAAHISAIAAAAGTMTWQFSSSNSKVIPWSPLSVRPGTASTALAHTTAAATAAVAAGVADPAVPLPAVAASAAVPEATPPAAQAGGCVLAPPRLRRRPYQAAASAAAPAGTTAAVAGVASRSIKPATAVWPAVAGASNASVPEAETPNAETSAVCAGGTTGAAAADDRQVALQLLTGAAAADAVVLESAHERDLGTLLPAVTPAAAAVDDDDDDEDDYHQAALQLFTAAAAAAKPAAGKLLQ